jgi:hypothetical protein
MGAGQWKEDTDLLVDPNKIGNPLRLINDITGIAKAPNVTMVEVHMRACIHPPPCVALHLHGTAELLCMRPVLHASPSPC